MEQTLNQQTNSGRVVFVDYLRVAACFLVMLVHASENFYGADASGLAGSVSLLANEENRFWVSFYDGTLGRTCVPLFMIVSAFLLVPLKPVMTMTQFYKRRALRILPPMLVFMLLYAFLPLLWGGMTWEQSLHDFKMILFNYPSMGGHLWFMYPLIGLYLIIPVVSPWLEKATAKEERIFIMLFLLSTFTSWIHMFIAPEVWGECWWNEFSMLWYCSGYLGYLVLAHYIRRHLNWSRSKKLHIGALCFVAGSLFTGWGFWMKGVPGVLIDSPTLEWTWNFCTPNVVCASFGAFLLFSCIERKQTPKCIATLSKLSFGMYLMHMFFLSQIASFIIQGNPAAPIIPVWLAIPVIAVLTFICCAVTTKLLSSLPSSKYIVG